MKVGGKDMAKILFSDVDGTLIEHGKAISEKNFEMMKEMQKQGHYIALCTGRNHIDIQPVLKAIDIPYDYLVLCNGSYIADKNGNILYEKHIDQEVARDIINSIIEMGDIVVAFCGEYQCPILIENQTYILGLNGPELIEGDFYEYLKNEKRFYMLSLHHKDLDVEIITKVAKMIKEKYPERIETHLNQQYIDVIPTNHSKGTGLIKLVEMLNDIEESYAIGDSFNDLPMIKAANVGATFNYAKQEIIEHSTLSVNYVYELIEKILS